MKDATGEAEGGRVPYLVFELAGRRFALPLQPVREVLRAVAITPLPEAPALVEGVIDVRGVLVPVLGGRRRVGLPPKSLEPEDSLILVDAPGRIVALRVDRVHWLVDVDPLAVDSARDLAPDAAYLAGIARLPDGLVLVHDLHRFLSAEEEAGLEQALGNYRAAGSEE